MSHWIVFGEKHSTLGCARFPVVHQRCAKGSLRDGAYGTLLLTGVTWEWLLFGSKEPVPDKVILDFNPGPALDRITLTIHSVKAGVTVLPGPAPMKQWRYRVSEWFLRHSYYKQASLAWLEELRSAAIRASYFSEPYIFV